MLASRLRRDGIRAWGCPCPFPLASDDGDVDGGDDEGEDGGLSASLSLELTYTYDLGESARETSMCSCVGICDRNERGVQEESPCKLRAERT